jgi:hypothetical protein
VVHAPQIANDTVATGWEAGAEVAATPVTARVDGVGVPWCGPRSVDCVQHRQR